MYQGDSACFKSVLGNRREFQGISVLFLWGGTGLGVPRDSRNFRGLHKPFSGF